MRVLFVYLILIRQNNILVLHNIQMDMILRLFFANSCDWWCMNNYLDLLPRPEKYFYLSSILMTRSNSYSSVSDRRPVWNNRPGYAWMPKTTRVILCEILISHQENSRSKPSTFRSYITIVLHFLTSLLLKMIIDRDVIIDQSQTGTQKQ